MTMSGNAQDFSWMGSSFLTSTALPDGFSALARRGEHAVAR